MKVLAIYLLKLQRLCIRNPKGTLGLAVAVMCLLGLGLNRLQISASLDDILDPHFDTSADYFAHKEKFNVKSPLFISIEPRSGAWQDSNYTQLQEFFKSIDRHSLHIEKLMTPFDFVLPEFQGDLLFYLPIVNRDENNHWTGWNELKASPWGGILMSKASPRLIAEVRFMKSDVDSRYPVLDPRWVTQLQQYWNSSEVNQTMRADWLGPGAYPKYLSDALTHDSTINNFLILVVIAIGFRVFYQTWRSSLMLAMTMGWTMIITFGAMGWAGYRINSLSNSVFLLVSLAALEDFVFLCLLRSGRSWRSSFREMLVPGFLTSFTTSLGFGSLLVSDFEVIRGLGLWAAFASMIEFVAVFLVLPALVVLISPLQDFSISSKNRISEWIESLRQHIMPRPVGFLLLSVFVIAIWAFQHLKVSDVPEDIFPKGNPFRDGNDRLMRDAGWKGQAFVVFTKGVTRPEEKKILDILATDPLVQKIDSLDEGLSFLEKGMTEIQKQKLWTDLMKRKALSRYISSDGTTQAIVYIRHVTGDSIRLFRERVASVCGARCKTTGIPIATSELGIRLPKTLIESLFVCLFLVGGVLLWTAKYTRSPHGIAVVVSSFWGPTVLLVFMVVFGIQVDLLTSMSITILVGLTGDNAIQYLWASRKRQLNEGLKSRGSASVQCAIMMSCGTLVYTHSSIDPLRSFAFLMVGGMICALVGDFWILGAIKSRKTAT